MKIALQEYLCWEIWASPKFPFAVSVLDYSFHKSRFFPVQLSDDPLRYYVSHLCSYDGVIRLTPPTTGEVDRQKKVPKNQNLHFESSIRTPELQNEWWKGETGLSSTLQMLLAAVTQVLEWSC